jgi:hypothetical protein
MPRSSRRRPRPVQRPASSGRSPRRPGRQVVSLAYRDSGVADGGEGGNQVGGGGERRSGEDGGGAGAGVGRNGTGNRGDGLPGLARLGGGRVRSALRLLGNDRKLMSCVCLPVRALDFLPVN